MLDTRKAQKRLSRMRMFFMVKYWGMLTAPMGCEEIKNQVVRLGAALALRALLIPAGLVHISR
ncbi:hypothetical protein CMV05_18790 [Vibrio anguillarum]|nr:hypothetical protein CMV05_07900 [Vibrio anguillarum]ATC57545.1 hypothetical protein CMV05_07930 [Vibrio anguillarum]ATC59472.1 hypothetical protein CMV05_18500 [Vibrio anguillarum]ATC59512.1 hypothetical protein CMV05_18790 [Vibrio anguillarum]MBF4252555.1 hypothetical protein [Vibrio anguillarum]